MARDLRAAGVAVARARRDLSRMVDLTMTPSQAHQLQQALAVLHALAPDEVDPSLLDIMAEINFQLATLLWPRDPAKKAPYPI